MAPPRRSTRRAEGNLLGWLVAAAAVHGAALLAPSAPAERSAGRATPVAEARLVDVVIDAARDPDLGDAHAAAHPGAGGDGRGAGGPAHSPPKRSRPAHARAAARLTAGETLDHAETASGALTAPEAGGSVAAPGDDGAGAGALAVGAGDRAVASGIPTAAERGAVLVSREDPCRGLFPYSADADSGSVSVEVHVAPTGEVSGHRVLEESPPRQGFALAASACASRLRFVAALDGAGRSVTGRSVVRLRFVRTRG